jgi:hypothetical protein
MVYSLSVFWLIWSPTEEVIYQAYCAARLRALTGSTWASVTLVGFWWAFQHSVFPLHLRLASYRLSFSAISTVSRSLSTHLSSDPPSPEDDHHALADGLVCGTVDAQNMKALKASPPSG